MNKEQQIEEFQNYIIDNLFDGGTYKLAEALYNAGYRKIPENSVVLTGTVNQERFVDLLVDFDECGFEPTITMPNPEEYSKRWKRKMLYAIGRLRRETAEEIFNRLVEIYSTVMGICSGCALQHDKNKNSTAREFLLGKYNGCEIARKEMKELAKERYGVEVEE